MWHLCHDGHKFDQGKVELKLFGHVIEAVIPELSSHNFEERAPLNHGDAQLRFRLRIPTSRQ